MPAPNRHLQNCTIIRRDPSSVHEAYALRVSITTSCRLELPTQNPPPTHYND